jgi:hypothetical protein
MLASRSESACAGSRFGEREALSNAGWVDANLIAMAERLRMLEASELPDRVEQLERLCDRVQKLIERQAEIRLSQLRGRGSHPSARLSTRMSCSHRRMRARPTLYRPPSAGRLVLVSRRQRITPDARSFFRAAASTRAERRAARSSSASRFSTRSIAARLRSRTAL